MSITLKNVSYTYAPGTAYETTAIRQISVKIEDGEFVGITGATGCGKSTLIQLMAGLLTPKEGQILLDGKDINARRYDRSRLRRQVGVVFQNPECQLFETTVYRDVTFALRQRNIPEAQRQQAAEQALAAVGFDYAAVKEKSPLEFSSGEQRRLAIAGILAAHPGILILDEPIAGLDPPGRRAFLELLDRLNAHGTTVIMVSHNTDALAEHCRRLLLLQDGHLLRSGSAAEIFTDTEFLQHHSFGIPQVVQIAQLLRQRGRKLAPGIFRYEQLLSALTGIEEAAL